MVAPLPLAIRIRNIAMSIDRLGRYEIVEDLGRGAMGVVYRARDPLIDRTVAIKTIACSGLSRDEVETFERRFFREAQSAGRLNHPNIVTIHEVGRDGDLAFIVMEYLHGDTLRSILDSGLVLTAQQVIDIAGQIADGLAFAHANNVVHRDIKPANIFVLANGRVKIADFGVALMPSGSVTLVGTVFGSPKYMSPEQVGCKPVDGRSDIFALGAVVYEMLTGVAPFQGDDLAAILHAVLETDPPPPSTRRRQLHPGFDRVVARALVKDPDQRYQSADEMAADLAACGQNEAVPVAPEKSPPVAGNEKAPSGATRRNASRVRIYRAVTAVAVAAAVLVIAYAAWLRPGKDAPATAAAPAAQARPTRTSAPAGPDWTRMRREIDECGRFNLICQEKVRWRYCANHWGKVPECPQGTSDRPAG